MTTFNTKNQAKRKYYYMACILVILLIVVSLAFNSFRNADNCDPNIGSKLNDKIAISEAANSAETAAESVKEYVTIDTDSGSLNGQKYKFNNITVHTFLGIPYAKPPVGDLRFGPTVPVGKWEGVRDALQQPASCLQSDSPLVLSAFRFLNATSSEDCLYLNIWSPVQEDSFLPVIVYIHGGAFAYGGVATEELDGLALAAQQDVVVVTLQYRLGIFGFMAFDGKEPKGNMGLYDQREALKWIHTNINKFGGDQDLITVVGHGAGAVSAGLHMMTPDSKFFFQRAILQGFGLLFNKELYYQTNKYSKKFAQEIGCDDEPDIKECLKTINVDRILEVQQDILEDNSVAFGPRIPSDFVATFPSEVKDGFDFQIDFMFGVNSEDDSLFMTTFKSSEENDKSDEEDREAREEGEDSETDDSSDSEDKEDKDDKENTKPVERPTMRPLLTAITSAAKTTVEPKTETTTPSETTTTAEAMTMDSKTTTTTTTTTTAPTTMTTTTTTTTTPKSTTSSSTEASTEAEDKEEEEEEKDETEREEKPDEESDKEEAESDSEGDDEANDDTEEKRKRRRRKRETDDYTRRVVCPLLRFSNQMVESNRTVYIYELMEFSSHHDEIVFAMGYPIRHKNLYDNEELKFSKRVMKNWAQFATNGDISETDDQWKGYTKEQPMFLKMSISTASLDKFNLNDCFPKVISV